ncbi:hypothetical protein GCM10022211_11310 [Sphingomonas humi]|uniref:Peptidase metallopeptidase domain-containing protein n=1 Tax=Sphingomonas humi TaxID=335630 RepID=A0ABP7RTD4_9SPHN
MVPGIDASIDSQAGGTLSGKPIFSASQVAAYLNRTGGGFVDGTNDSGLEGRQNNIGDDNKVITFGFFNTLSQVYNNGYTYTANNAQGQPTLYGLAEAFNFAAFTDPQRAATREAMQSWDDVAGVTFREASADDADINFANLASAPDTQAYARLPTLSLDQTLGGQVREIGGDVWVSRSQASNFQLDEGGYGLQTLVHEAGHALGLSHPGAYNAAPGVSITYGVNAEYAQDTRAYTVMSYFNASSLGARHFDFNISGTVYSGVPLIHDILAIQRMYGADMTTRTGDTVYGFNSTADRDSFDFNKTPAPVMAIWDAGGNDTIDASGYATRQVIDLTPGSLSSIGGVTFDTAPSYEQVLANRTAAGISNSGYTRAIYDSNMAALKANAEVGRLTDNVGIAYGVIIENAIGGSGADTIIGNSVDNVLKGNAGNDLLAGGAGNDTLDGGIGDDQMLGGIGDDLFMVDAAGDIVTENVGEGTDKVLSSIDYTLGANVENLTLTGSAMSGTGNELNNLIVGNALANTLTGAAGDDRLEGGAGNDLLDGGTGNDAMLGGVGDDRYIVDAAGDTVTELANEGTDTVWSAINYTLGANLENLTLTGSAANGTGNDLNNVIVGNALANVLSGGNGNDRLEGGGGSDSLYGGAGNDRLIGGDGRDFVWGGTGADVFVADLNSTRVLGKTGSYSTDTFLDFTAGLDKIDLSSFRLGSLNVTTIGNNTHAGDITIRLFDSVKAAETALGFDIDGTDGASPYNQMVTVLYINVDGGAPDIALSLIGTVGVSTNDMIFA